MGERISDLYINFSFLSFFKIFFRVWENAARLFFNLSDTLLQWSFLQDFIPILCFCWSLLHILLMLVSIEIHSRFMLLTIVYVVFLHIPFHLIYSIFFRAIYLCNEYIYFKLHHYVCLMNPRLLLAGLVHCLYILIGQFCFWFFIFILKFWVANYFCRNVFSSWFP